MSAPTSLVESLKDRYRFDRELGAGGMATVYLADDLKHQRKVAIKVLRPELAAVLGEERFQREITTTANLRHPNILPLFDSGEGAGFFFYVMPLLEGESLRERLNREKQLPLPDALHIADEVADALHYAHGRGVIHRDIKPENIFLESGHAIVADFGIAHADAAPGDVPLTMVGMSLGTPHYMSPEQSSGERVDARSDLYALGCVTYEMIVGRPPFSGPNAMAIMMRHAIEPVPSIQTVLPDLAPGVCDAVARAMAKAPSDRFGSVLEWRQALKENGSSNGANSTGLPVRGADIHKPPPVPATVLLGREEQLATAIGRVQQGARLLSITGHGGTGKTRFAVELFQLLRPAYRHGAAFVSLASVTTSADVLPAISIALDVAESHSRSALDAVCTLIGDRQVLLVLDNLEQVLEAAGDIASLIARCPSLVIVATSRAPLKIGAESEFVLPPLQLPAVHESTPEAVERSAAVALFVQRAQKVQPGFVVSASNAKDIAAICRQLDGLPLALELAAARVRLLAPSALLKRLDHALDLLTSGDRDLPLRQRTLRATINWSYSLLSPDEQRLLRHLSVFHEGWTLDAMEHICYNADERHRALDEFDSLVEKGLVRVVTAAERYSLLETIRAFASEQLDVAGNISAVRTSHADYFVEFARDVAEGVKGIRQLESMRRSRAENANMLAALQWLGSCASGGDSPALEKGLMLIGHLNWPWHIAGLHQTMREQVDVLLALAMNRPGSYGRALALWSSVMVCTTMMDGERAHREMDIALDDARAGIPPQIVAELHAARAYLCLTTGRVEDAHAAVATSIALATSCGARWVHGMALMIRGILVFVTGDPKGGAEILEAARRIVVPMQDYEISGIALSFLAQIRFAQGKHDDALRMYRDALVELELVGDKPEIARVHGEMGWTALAAENHMEAQQCFLRALRSYDEVGSQRGTGQAMTGLAATEAIAGRLERALAIAAAAQVMSERAGAVVGHPMAPGVTERIDALRQSIPGHELNAIMASGGALTPSQVIAMLAT